MSCNRPVDPRWAVCPYCETPLRRPEREEEPRRAPARAAPARPRGRRPPREAPPRKAPSGRRAKSPPGTRSSPLLRRPRRRLRARSAASARRAPSARRATTRPPTTANPARAGARPRLPEPQTHRLPRLERSRHVRDDPHPDPRQARRLRARPHRRGHRPLRAQGPAPDRAQADHRRRGDRARALRRAHRASRSSASSSTSSPAARWSPRCSRASRPSRRPAS